LKKDIIDAREKIKETRLSLTGGVIEKNAKEAGKSIVEFSKDSFDRLEQSLSNISSSLSTGAYQLKEKAKHGADEIAEDIKKVYYKVRDTRREITGGYVEDKVKETLDDAVIRLDEVINKILKDDEKKGK
jgi:gas vesicle protein